MFTNKQKGILLIVACVAAINSSFGQSYSHSPADTLISFAIPDHGNVFNITQLHPTNDTLYFKWNKQFVSMPVTWEASLCDNGHCYTSLVDSGSMDPVYTGDIGLMSLHLNPHLETGTGIVRYTIYTTDTPAQVDTLTWIITVGPTSIPDLAFRIPQISMHQQTLSIQQIDKRFTSLTLFDLSGRVRYSTKLDYTKSTFILPSLQQELLILVLEGDDISYKLKILNQ